MQLKNFLLAVTSSLFFQGFNSLASAKTGQTATLMFYNCENLFDTYDNPKTSDNEFLPNSRKNWTQQKFKQKIENIGKVILATGIEPPAVVGLAEVENFFVVKQLISKTGLQKFPYYIIHQDSPDPRGIDVAVIYRPDKLKVLSYTFFRVTNEGKDRLVTRDIVYVKGILFHKDTVHLFYNHWPSRLGNHNEKKRIFVAKLLRSKVDSIFYNNCKAKIVIMGDFNDNPDNNSITLYLKANGTANSNNPYQLFNHSYEWLKNISWRGTYKYKSQWNIFDQIITSLSLLQAHAPKGSCFVQKAEIFAPSFLLIPDEKYGNSKPYKTYNGFVYSGGFSDHLPVILRMESN
jgi:hypothetical protein